MNVDIITPEKKLYSGTAKSVYVPGVSGEFQMLDNHAPIVSVLKSGKIKLESPELEKVTELFQKGEKDLYEFFVKGGVIEMNQDKIIILVE